MRYVSTRDATHAAGLSSAIARGLAPDGGLYVPEALPRFRPGELEGHTDLPGLAEALLRPFVAGDAMAGWIGAGATLTLMSVNLLPLGLLVPALWAADFAPTYEVDLEPVPQPAADPQAFTDEPGKDVKVVVVNPAPGPAPRATRR